MRAAKSRTIRLSVAAGALSAAFAVLGAPTAAADPCPNGEMALDGTCIPISSPLDTASATLGLPDGTVNDVVPSSPQNQCADVECIVAAPGYNAGNNGGGSHGGTGGGGGGGGGHGR
jgi:hypothetical protein